MALHLSEALRSLVSLQKELSRLGPDALDRAASEVTARILDITEADGVALGLVEGDMLRLAWGVGTITPYEGRSIPIRDSFSARSITTDAVVLTPDVQSELSSPSARKLAELAGWHSYMGIPLRSGGRVLGVLGLVSCDKNVFSEDDVAMCELMTSGLGMILGHMLEHRERVRLSAENERAQLAVVDQEALVRGISESTHITIGLAERIPGTPGDHRYLSANPMLVALLNRPAEQLVGKLASEVGLSAEERGRWEDYYQRCLSNGGSHEFEYNVQTRLGDRVFRTALFALPLARPEDSQRFCYLVEDITEKKRVQQELEAADRRAALGYLSASVAHEIRAPVSFVQQNLRYLRQSLAAIPHDPELDSALLDSEDGMRRISRISESLLNFSRQHAQSASPLDLRQPVEMAVKMVRADVTTAAALKLELGSVPQVMAEDTRITQVVVNLLLNAIKAFPSPRQPTHAITVRTELDVARDSVLLSVTDNGRGIAPERLERLFDPYFVNGSAPHGNGLGLSICRSIVHSFGGEISAKSRVDEGTTVTLRLPIATKGKPAQGEGTRLRVV